ncbi:hypothetical protein BGX27_007814 [Mortierella sp. AM989]|nr:hypothetical protein BGX27_007814 [Mortierella sp. AM989]
MTLKARFRRQSSHSSAAIIQLDSSRSYHALQIPEILCIIFSFLNHYTLKSTARYVCKIWLAEARPFINTSVLWQPNLSPPYNHDFLLDHLHLVTELRAVNEQSTYNESIPKTWERLLDKIQSLKDTNRLRITKLVLRASILEYILPSAITTLTNLDLRLADTSIVHIGLILAKCPKLQSLNVENGYLSKHYQVSNYKSIVLEKSDLETLIIKRLYVAQGYLEEILAKCPRLQVLKLLEIIRLRWEVPTFNRLKIYSAAATSCPMLRLFHFSVLDNINTSEEALAMIQTFVPSHQPSIAIEGNHQRQPLNIDTISVFERDLHKDTSDTFFAPFLNTDYNNFITTLEIVPSMDESLNPFIGHALHDLLCAASSLLHLLAPSIPYFAEYLDLSGSEGRSTSDIRTTKKIWACRRLQTLHIKFVTKDSVHHASAKESRIMFGYIANICPNLRELAIVQLALDLKLKGGLCYLTGLKSLQRLTILTWTRTNLEKRDLEWIKPHPCWKGLEKSSSIVKRVPRNTGKLLRYYSKAVDAKVDRHQRGLTGKDLENIGSLSNFKAFQKQLAQDRQEELHCWPMLEFLGICLTLVRDGEIIDSEHYLPELISELRPGVEFSCNYNNWQK